MDARAVGVTARLLVRGYMLLHALLARLRSTEARQVSDGARAITFLAELVVAAVAFGCSLGGFVLPNASGHIVPLTELTISTALLDHLRGKFLKLLLGAATRVSGRHDLELKVFFSTSERD
jgi:hypothetical protein